MSQDAFPDYESDEIDLTNRELVSLFIQYPDMPDMPGDDDTESVVASDFGEDVDTTTLSDTTTRTTPLRNDPAALLGSRPMTEFSIFMQRLNESNLPQKAIDYFQSLGHMILQIGRLLFPPTGNMSVTQEDLQEACDICGQMVSLLAPSCQRVNDQIDNIAYILTLAPFTAQPGPEDLWSNYKQMAELIIEHTRLPSRHERDLLICLVHVYDAYVYQPALTRSRQADYDQPTLASLDDLYHAIMMVEERYKHWCNDVKELGDLHTKPTMRRILKSPPVMKLIAEHEDMKEAAESAASDPDGPGLQPVSKRVLELLRANARRRQLQGSVTKTRFRREHTV